MAIRNVPKSLLFPSSDSDKKVRLVALEDLSRWTAIGYNRIKDIPVENINGHKMVWINVAHHNYVPDTPVYSLKQLEILFMVRITSLIFMVKILCMGD